MILRSLALAILVPLLPCATAAQDYPTRPIRAIIPFAAGGVTDIVARIVLERLAVDLGQSAVIENRPNAGGTTAVLTAARSEPDGHTLLLADPFGTLPASVTLYPHLGQDLIKDLAPVALLGTTAAALYVSKELKVASLEEFLAYAKSNPGKLSFGSTGFGTPGHLNVELFKRQFGIEATHVPYRVITQGVTDLVTGQIQFWIGPIPAFLGQVQGGQLRALAVANDTRWPDLPDVPTIKEIGRGNYNASSSYAIFVPRGTPAAIIARLFEAARKLLEADDINKRLRIAGVEPEIARPETVAEILRSRTAQWRDVIRAAGITLESK